MHLFKVLYFYYENSFPQWIRIFPHFESIDSKAFKFVFTKLMYQMIVVNAMERVAELRAMERIFNQYTIIQF